MRDHARADRCDPGRRRDRDEVRPRRTGRFASHVSGKPQPCIGFAHSFETPRLQISGWSCQGDNPQIQRQAVACALDRLTMLSAGNDPKLAELFARAELRRAGCGALAPASADWVTATHEPRAARPALTGPAARRNLQPLHAIMFQGVARMTLWARTAACMVPDNKANALRG